MGGGFVLTMAKQQGAKVAAAVPFYPAGPTPDDYTGLEAAVQGHFGEKDDFVPTEKIGEIKAKITSATGREPEFHVYPAGHAFLNDENRLGTYDPDQAKLAWDRAVGFLRQHLS